MFDPLPCVPELLFSLPSACGVVADRPVICIVFYVLIFMPMKMHLCNLKYKNVLVFFAKKCILFKHEADKWRQLIVKYLYNIV